MKTTVTVTKNGIMLYNEVFEDMQTAHEEVLNWVQRCTTYHSPGRFKIYFETILEWTG